MSSNKSIQRPPQPPPMPPATAKLRNAATSKQPRSADISHVDTGFPFSTALRIDPPRNPPDLKTGFPRGWLMQRTQVEDESMLMRWSLMPAVRFALLGLVFTA